MRTSILTRSAVAVASLAIGSVALAAAPATADTPSGVTRGTVLASADSNYSDSTRTLIEKVCGFTSISDYGAQSLDRSDDVAAVLVTAGSQGEESSDARYCTFAAFATTEPFADLSGTVAISADQFVASGPIRETAVLSQSFTLSGDLFVTPPITDQDYFFNSTSTASGNVTKVEQATTATSRVSTPKSTAYKAKALRSYERSIAKAEAKLSKALKRAGDSKSKKAAARKTFKASKKAAKATLHVRWSSDKKTVVTTTVGKTTATPFSISTDGCRFDSSNTDATAAGC